MLKLINDGKLVMLVRPGSQFSLPTGDVVSPAYAGWSSRGYSLVEQEFGEHQVANQQPTQEEQESMRLSAYRKEADPLFFKWQAGEATEAEWKAKRQEIRDRFPYPEA